LAVEAGAVGGHQVDALHPLQPGRAQQRVDHQAPQAAALQVARHDDVPQHGAAEPVAAGPAKAHQPPAAPEAHHRRAARQQPAQIGVAAAFGPEGVLVEQALQFEYAAAGP